jgi:hypothetical protein
MQLVPATLNEAKQNPVAQEASESSKSAPFQGTDRWKKSLQAQKEGETKQPPLTHSKHDWLLQRLHKVHTFQNYRQVGEIITSTGAQAFSVHARMVSSSCFVDRTRKNRPDMVYVTGHSSLSLDAVDLGWTAEDRRLIVVH